MISRIFRIFVTLSVLALTISFTMSKSIKSFFSTTATVKRPASEISATTSESASSTNDVREAKIGKVSQDTTVSEPTSGWLPFDTLEPVWKSKLLKERSKPYFQRLEQFVESEAKSHTVFPPRAQIFSALNLCPFDDVKVVVIGQDPYHGPGQAHGLAFSVQRGVEIPPSLRNMIKEAKVPAPGHGNLESWSQQGVLMLNTCLTVRKGEANSHQKHGWEEFTDAIVKELARKENLVYLLWGKPAQLKCQCIDATKNTLITTSHPSPLGAFKTDKPFMGSNCFVRCNDALTGYGKTPVNWTIR